MPQSPRTRAAVAFLLLCALFGLTVFHGTLEPEPSMGAFAGQEDLGDDYDRYLGERVSVEGWIVETDPAVIEAEYGVDSVLRLRIVGLDGSIRISEGKLLRVYGVVEGDRTIRALNAFAVPRSAMWYTWSISFLAGLWVLGRIVRYWRVDRAAWSLRRRSRPLCVRSWLRSRFLGEGGGGGSGDA